MLHFELFGALEGVPFADGGWLQIGEVECNLGRSTLTFKAAWSNILTHSSSLVSKLIY